MNVQIISKELDIHPSTLAAKSEVVSGAA